MTRTIAISLLGFLLVGSCFAQSVPHVDALIKSLDGNKDGFVTPDEVVGNKRYARTFPRWDADKNGRVSKLEIVRYRAKFGIAADGTRVLQKPEGKRLNQLARPRTRLVIPTVEALDRVGRETRLTPMLMANSQYVLRTSPHEVRGTEYVVVTDHNDPAYLKTLERLVHAREGKLIRVGNLADLHEDDDGFDQLSRQLGTARYVAIAPQLQNFRENMVLSMWELLSTLDEDPALDCFPGFLVASNPSSFQRLIDQSIEHQPIPSSRLRPLAINQVVSSRETRSLQKSGILRNHFQRAGLETPIIAIYGDNSDSAPQLKGDQTWNLKVPSRGQFIRSFAKPIQQKLEDSNLIVMHGHGIPGMSCSMDIDAIPANCSGKILMSGSCFSAAPPQSDIASMKNAPGGYQVKPREAFILRAVDNGAIVAFGHQRLSSGFPFLYPVLESWLDGQTVGEAYQQLINGMIDRQGAKSGDFILTEEQLENRRPPQQKFLYIVIGDPALQPFAKVTFDRLPTKPSRP